MKTARISTCKIEFITPDVPNELSIKLRLAEVYQDQLLVSKIDIILIVGFSFEKNQEKSTKI